MIPIITHLDEKSKHRIVNTYVIIQKSKMWLINYLLGFTSKIIYFLIHIVWNIIFKNAYYSTHITPQKGGLGPFHYNCITKRRMINI